MSPYHCAGSGAGTWPIDLIVEGRLIIEIKAIDRLLPIHQAQVITYLKLTGCEAGLILNFNATTIRAGLKRLDHPDVYIRKHAARDQSPERR